MFKSMRNMPIYRRLFIAFALATVIPGVIVESLGILYISALNTQSFTAPLVGYTIVALVITVLITLGTSYIVGLTITKPLRQLVTLTKRIARGETDARAEIKGNDEIYAVASSINNMLEHIVRLVQETQDSHKHLQSQVAKLVSEISGVGQGDLTIQAEVTVGELGTLATSFNYMIEGLGNLVARVKTLTKEVGATTTMSFKCMSQLEQISVLQNQQILAATTKVGDMATSSRNVAKRAQHLSDIAHNARYTVQDGHVAIQKTISGIEHISQNMRVTSEKMQALSEHSREIGDIVNVLAGIANQTNRLALDVSIQATMAGENGHCLSTIATDIRNLAERSKEQTSTMSHIVNTVLEDINSATHSMEDTKRETVTDSRLVEEAGHALDSVFSVIEQQANEIATINQIAGQQLESSNTIMQIMQNVSDSTRQSNTTIHETARLMEHVTLLAAQLHDSVHVFKVHEGRMRGTTGKIYRSLPEPKRLDRIAFNSAQQASFGPTTQPLQDDLPLANQSSFSPATPYPLSQIPAIPDQAGQQGEDS